MHTADTLTPPAARLLEALKLRKATSRAPGMSTALRKQLAYTEAQFAAAVEELRALGLVNIAAVSRPGKGTQTALWPTGLRVDHALARWTGERMSAAFVQHPCRARNPHMARL